MGTRRWILLGLNLLLATAILAQPRKAASARNSEDCLDICGAEWSACVENEGWDCHFRFSRCLEETCWPIR
ncbi:hypothetical protein [Candidatus Palauibacter sp.]|uniref:hypothetical protein n=1 Tax=Candidatus Palauibacter sp. TaxID=3101350 RepID=UPI003B5B7899